MSLFRREEKPAKVEKYFDDQGKEVPQYMVDPEFCKRREGELQQAYNERVPMTFQPVVDITEYDYLGRKRK